MKALFLCMFKLLIQHFFKFTKYSTHGIKVNAFPGVALLVAQFLLKKCIMPSPKMLNPRLKISAPANHEGIISLGLHVTVKSVMAPNKMINSSFLACISDAFRFSLLAVRICPAPVRRLLRCD